MYQRILCELVADTLGFDNNSLENTDVYGFIFAGYRGGSCSLTPSTIYWQG